MCGSMTIGSVDVKPCGEIRAPTPFHAAAVHVRGHGVRLTDMTAQVMDVQPGDPVWVMPLDW